MKMIHHAGRLSSILDADRWCDELTCGGTRRIIATAGVAPQRSPAGERFPLLQRLQILDQVGPLVVAQLVAEAVAAVAEAEPRGVVVIAGLGRGEAARDGSEKVSNFQPTFTRS